MTDEYLIKQGFIEFKPGPFHNHDVEKCFQKRYDDEIGKKYFITIEKWKSWKHPHTHEVIEGGYEYSTQLYKRDTHEAVDLLFHSHWKLEDVEKYLLLMFNTGMFDYYERFEE